MDEVDAPVPGTQHVHFVLYGDVQGVGFRAFTLRCAQKLDIARGYVRNRTDGGVEVEAAGDTAAVHEFRTAVQRGPAYARVRHVHDVPTGSTSLPSPFTILR
jgi:acylphosphatase